MITTVVQDITVINEGVSATDVAGDIDNALGKLWDDTVAAVDAALAAAIAGIQKAITDLG